MEKLVVEATNYLPRIDFSPEGQLVLEGRAIPEDASRFFEPMIRFVDELETEEVTFKINLDYFNTASSKKLLELLKHIDVNDKIQKVRINWHFEEGDEDSVETAEIYEEILDRADFSYIEYSEVA
jgi:hypothetical protein